MLLNPSRYEEKYEMFTIGGPLAVPLIGIRRPIEREWVNIAAICVHFENSHWIA